LVKVKKEVFYRLNREEFIKFIQNKKDSLTNNQQKFAKYVVDHLNKIAISTIKDLSMESDVSSATIVRFSKQLGFSGFNRLQKEIKKTIFGEELSYTGRIERVSLGTVKEENIFLSSIFNDKKCLDNILVNNSVRKFEEAVELLLKANKIYFHAVRSSSYVANLFNHFFKQLNPNTVNLVNSINFFEEVVNISSSDLLISINFPRYAEEGIRVVNFTKRKKAKVILITDSNLAPNAEKADILFLFEYKSLSFFNNYIGVVVLINALLTGLVIKNKTKYYERLKSIDDLERQSGILVQ